ncbi:hypothetical protein QYE76_024557 [Lolium multiflorum]|uniref:CCHC-type domain-containing protein n=1 Tax=Lolium multiflorum TaxID=4521 RepID=A0AAD8VVT6_LOLMU|nr:hypothetical protein QYE76_024557 [Lolium multiflorum]
MIHMAVTPKDRAHIRLLKTAKEAWDKLDKLFLGNESIQSSRFDEVNNMADNFIMNEGESPEEMYRRLIALAVQMQDLGATFVDDPWIKRKFYNALLPYEEVKLTAIRQNASFRAMTSDEVLSEVIALDISKKNVEDLVARALNTRKPNLALTMKEHGASESDDDPIEWGPDDLKANYHEHMALAAKSFWSGNKTRSSRPRRYSSHDSTRLSFKSPREEQKGSSCYNCGDKSHFVADCIYERREDNGGKLVRKSKFISLSKGFSKFSSNYDDTKISSTKKPRAFIIREEYSFDEGDEREDKGKEGETATIAISTLSISPFDSPNENLITNTSHCLVAKVLLEVEPLSEPTSLPNTISIVVLDASSTNMLGDQDHMMENERLEKKEELDLISITRAYEEEVCMRMSLEASALILEDSNNSLISQLIKDRDYALGWVNELKAKKLYLEEIHEWSLEDKLAPERYYRSRYRASTDMASPINFNQFLEKEKLKSNGSNFTDWFRHVRIFLAGENLQYMLDSPLGDPPAETETDEVKNVYATRKDLYSQVQCAILCSLEANLQKCFEHHDPHELVNELKAIFETHAAVECYEASKHFFSCMMEEGSSVSEHMLVMTGHAKKLSDLGIVIPNRLGINRVLQSLPPSYKNFVMNYNMQNMNKELPELFGMLKAAEIEIKKEHQVLMVNKTTSFKK